MSEECALGCGKPVNPHDLQTWHEITAWVGGPKKDHSRLRDYTGRVAHNHCVGKLQQGQAVDQPDLFAKAKRVPKKDRPPLDEDVVKLFND